MFNKIIIYLLLISCVLLASQAQAVTLFGVTCEPSAGPDSGGCGLPELIQMLAGIIEFMQVIIIPIAVGFIIWGGIVIMTAGGSEEKVKQGKKIITSAVVGVAISLGAYLIINAVLSIAS
ncbi:MAG: hypothetical protein Q8Q37_00345 [bacterium]|nr:hypothetical protein [bacterium]